MRALKLVCCGLVVSALGCDDVVKVRNLAPEVESQVGLCTADDRVYFVVALQDFEEDDVDVEILAGGKPILVGPTGDGALGLRTDRDFPGKHHWIEWAAEACEGEGSCPTALCHTLADGPLDAAKCAPLAASPLSASITVAASDGEDTSPRVSQVAQVEAGAEIGPCDFTLGAHE